ncbi:chaperone protein dnaJ C76, chloroplastic isoform X2 [Nymphaea colorata]|uniref:chaperone protein dnaJ C76, chloroplastic isoform X2 n=1 Tax=Nymphaea colorata TaxID=210225 RepID=UPI00129D5676|nr:chaperone protein dnaJ C76, chloroplastic isoform X2 [Nymphaea colorata]
MMCARTGILVNGFSFSHNRQGNTRKLGPRSIRKQSTGLSIKSCRVDGNSWSSVDYDLYELLGVDPHSDQSVIREAYRSLQKRCHPDIAGPAGHDMAIILNQAYSLLSDPLSRLLYDQEQAKMVEFNGYTGNPVYSVWMGSEKEDRAVFVDEVKCVGCLKCALLAERTFGIESVYGRARVVAQWADPAHIIEDAIRACPVDCISVVKRSDLAALEFLMSKQPRGNVRVGSDGTAGKRVANVFVDANKFQSRFKEMKEKAQKPHSQPDPQRAARMAAIQAIKSISGWWQFQSFVTTKNKRRNNVHGTPGTIVRTRRLLPGTDKLREAAARRRAGEDVGRTYRKKTTSLVDEEYWTPMRTLPAPIQSCESTRSHEQVTQVETENVNNLEGKNQSRQPTEKHRDHRITIIPLVAAGIAAIVTRLDGGSSMSSGLKEHLAGATALQIVNSLWLQVFLAATTWYVVGFMVVSLVSSVQKQRSE